MSNHHLKTLRDKLNGSLMMAPDENEEMLLEQWNQVHTLEAPTRLF